MHIPIDEGVKVHERKEDGTALWKDVVTLIPVFGQAIFDLVGELFRDVNSARGKKRPQEPAR